MIKLAFFLFILFALFVLVAAAITVIGNLEDHHFEGEFEEVPFPATPPLLGSGDSPIYESWTARGSGGLGRQ